MEERDGVKIKIGNRLRGWRGGEEKKLIRHPGRRTDGHEGERRERRKRREERTEVVSSFGQI